MEDLEQECEDALFEVCDARERYPQRCADELQKCIKLQNEINMIQVLPMATKKFDFPDITEEQNAILEAGLNKRNMCFKYLDQKLDRIINKYENLKAAMDQIEREKDFEINRLLSS